MPKKVFISHSSADNVIAQNLANLMRAELGEEQVWIDLFNLDGSARLATVIPLAIQEANWFILLASNASMSSRWVQYEASIATLLEIERENYNILTIKLEDCKFPPELDIQLRSRKYLNASENMQETLLEAITLIKNDHSSPKAARHREPFVGRGKEQDDIELTIARHKVVFLLGLEGIGKSSLVRKLASSRFERELLQLDLKASHDMELLTRQLISLTGNIQPPENASDEFLLETATFLIKQRISQGAMLFLNHAEKAINIEGVFQPFLRDFLQKYVDEEISFPVFIASTRVTDLSPEDIVHTYPIRIPPLKANFMSLAIQQWHSFMYADAPNYSENDLAPLVEKLGGYPLAAKLIAGRLAFETPQNLIQKTSLTKFQHSIAEFILNRLELEEIDRYVLYAMSIYDSAINVRYLLSVKRIAAFGQEKVNEAVEKLTRSMIISQLVDAYTLHQFIAAYFVDEALKKKVFDEIARDLANAALNDTRSTLQKLEKIPKNKRTHENLLYINYNRDLLEVAVPTHRLLMVTGRQKELEKGGIPYKLEGHLREMVFTMYEKAENYKSCVDFAKQWLKIRPDDSEILIYLARAYRELQQYDDAENILNQLEYGFRSGGPKLQSQVYRERGKIAYQQNHLDDAIEMYESGLIRKRDGTPRYAQIYVDYARALVAKANSLSDGDREAQRCYIYAAELLEEAKPHIPRFEQFHQGLYASVQWRTGRISREAAIEMLKEALVYQSREGHIYLRLADLLSEGGRQVALQQGLEYAKKAKDLNTYGSILTIADIYIKINKFQDALRELSNFDSRFEKDALVADVLRARAQTGLREFKKARQLLQSRSEVSNSYVTKAQIQNEISAAQDALYRQQFAEAAVYIQDAETLLDMSKETNLITDTDFFNKTHAQIEAVHKKLS